MTDIRPRDWARLLCLSLLWGGSFFCSKFALAELPPLTLVLARVVLAALALALVLRLSGQRLPRGRATWTAFLGMGLLNNILPFSLLFWGQTQIASGLASILNATTPVFAILVTRALVPGTEITPNRLAGVVLGITGVAVLMGGDAIAAQGFPLLPMLACLGAAFCYGLAGVFGLRFRQMQLSPVAGAFGQLAASSALMLPVALLHDRPWALPPPGAATLAAVLALAFLSTGLAYVLYFRSLETIGQLNTSLVTLLVPASAILLGALILGERLGPGHYAGLAIIALGLLAIDGRLLARLRRQGLRR